MQCVVEGSAYRGGDFCRCCPFGWCVGVAVVDNCCGGNCGGCVSGGFVVVVVVVVVVVLVIFGKVFPFNIVFTELNFLHL